LSLARHPVPVLASHPLQHPIPHPTVLVGTKERHAEQYSIGTLAEGVLG